MNTFSLTAGQRVLVQVIRASDARLIATAEHPRALRVYANQLVIERKGKLLPVTGASATHVIVAFEPVRALAATDDVNVLAPVWAAPKPAKATTVPDVQPQEPAQKPALVKGSPEAKAHMADLRAKQTGTPKGNSAAQIAALTKSVADLQAAMVAFLQAPRKR